MLFDFIHLPVSHLSNAALSLRERFTGVPSVVMVLLIYPVRL